MKSFVLCVLVMLSLKANSQTAKDYFFPTNDKNCSVFKSHIPGKKNQFEHNQSIFFKDMGDSALVTTMFYDEDTLKGGHEQVLKIKDSEILVVKGKANTYQGKVETYSSGGSVIFKMPTNNGKTEWSSPNQKGAVITIYRSEFATIKVDGRKTKAVKVSRIQKRKHTGEESVFYVNYYVAGIGLYKTTSESGYEIDLLANQKFESSIPTIN